MAPFARGRAGENCQKRWRNFGKIIVCIRLAGKRDWMKFEADLNLLNLLYTRSTLSILQPCWTHFWTTLEVLCWVNLIQSSQMSWKVLSSTLPSNRERICIQVSGSGIRISELLLEMGNWGLTIIAHFRPGNLCMGSSCQMASSISHSSVGLYISGRRHISVVEEPSMTTYY